MTSNSPVPRVPKAEMIEYSRELRAPAAEMTEFSPVPAVPEAETTGTWRYGYSVSL